jgi:hypothetical protein
MLRRLLAVGPVVACALACASPTLPLPPPVAPTIARLADGVHVRLSSGCGGVEDDAVVIVVNENPTVPGDQAVGGAIATPCGSWDATVTAQSGDVLSITQEVASVGSQATTVQVP